MLITFNAPLAPSWAISGAGAALLSPDFSGLSDGRPGTQATFRGCTSAANKTVLTATGFSLPVAAGQPYYLVVGIINSTLALGSIAQIAVNGAWSGAGTRSQAFVQHPQALAPLPAQQPYMNAWYVLTPSQLSGSTPITQLTVSLATASASQVFSLGEIVVGLAVDLPINSLDVTWDDPSKLNRASGNQPYPVLRKPFRKVQAQIAPQTLAQAFGSAATTSASVQAALYAIATQPKVAIVPRWRQRGYGAPDPDLIQRFAHLARCTSLPTLKSQGSEDWFSGSIGCEELL